VTRLKRAIEFLFIFVLFPMTFGTSIQPL